MNNIDPIQEELAQAGEASPITPSLLQLDSCRIMTDTEVPEEEFLFRMYGKPCFPRRDISTVTGMEKCGKTIFTSMLMACCAEKNVLELERIREEQLKVMWYDTEQSKQSTKGILTKRVKKLVKGDFPEENFFVFNVRACTYEERLELLITGIQTYKPDMVIIDNISDLLPSVNDSEQSSKIIEQLMVLSTEYDCNITVVIHLNRSGEKRQEKAGTFNQKYIIRHEGNTRQPWEWNLRLLFNEAMGPVAEMAPEGLRDKVMKIAGIQQPKYYDKVLTLATEKRIVKTTIAKNGRVVVIPIPS